MKRMGMPALCLGGLVLAGLAVVLGFAAVAPVFVVGGCALMMVMMMRDMRGGGHHADDKPS